MNTYEKVVNKEDKIAVVGLGYVGMPLALAFSKAVNVIGFDLNEEKICSYQNGYDPTNEVGDEAIKQCSIHFTSNESDLKEAKVFIVAVPTPINADKTPDLKPVIEVSKLIGRHLTKGSIVVYESTVYPGVTENICIPILEGISCLTVGVDFKVGYSPERINPGDQIHRLENIVKIVSGINQETLEEVGQLYELIIEAGVFKASSIKIAEAAKVVENSQRDINIAFMNELAMVFDYMQIDTREVIEAMNTKWNSLGFYPGLVGGHCIGVDPYYFIYEAEKLGYHSQIISAGRKINDGMGEYIADKIVKKLIHANKMIKSSKVVIFGLTFKENCADIRNTKVIDIINQLRTYGIQPLVVDPYADPVVAKKEYNIDLIPLDYLSEADCLVFAVAHSFFKNLSVEQINGFLKDIPNQEKVIIDVKGIMDKDMLIKSEYNYWRL